MISDVPISYGFASGAFLLAQAPADDARRLGVGIRHRMNIGKCTADRDLSIVRDDSAASVEPRIDDEVTRRRGLHGVEQAEAEDESGEDELQHQREIEGDDRSEHLLLLRFRFDALSRVFIDLRRTTKEEDEADRANVRTSLFLLELLLRIPSFSLSLVSSLVENSRNGDGRYL